MVGVTIIGTNIRRRYSRGRTEGSVVCPILSTPALCSDRRQQTHLTALAQRAPLDGCQPRTLQLQADRLIALGRSG